MPTMQFTRPQQYQALIGAGGTGCDMLVRIARLQKKFYQPEQRPRTHYILIDTDPKAIDAASRVLATECDVQDVHIRAIHLDNRIVIQALNNPTFSDEFSRIVLSGGFASRGDDGSFTVDRPMLVNASLQMGNYEAAQQTPAFSRMMFIANAHNVVPAIEESLQQLQRDEANGLARAGLARRPKVDVFGSSFGGTGAGIVLPIMCVVRNYRKNDVRLSLWLFDGSFAPDSCFDSNNDFIRRGYTNAIRCEREIDVAQMGLQTIGDSSSEQGGITSDFILPSLCQAQTRHPEYFRYDEVNLLHTETLGGMGHNVAFNVAKERIARVYVERARLFVAIENNAQGIENDRFRPGVAADAEHLCQLNGMERSYSSASSFVLKFPRKLLLNVAVYKTLITLCQKAQAITTSQPPRQLAFPSVDDYIKERDKFTAKRKDSCQSPDQIKRFDLDQTTRAIEDEVRRHFQGKKEALEKSLSTIFGSITKTDNALKDNSLKDSLEFLTAMVDQIERQKKVLASNALAENSQRSQELLKNREIAYASANDRFGRANKRTIYLNALQKSLNAQYLDKVLNSYIVFLDDTLNQFKEKIERRNAHIAKIDLLRKKIENQMNTELSKLEASDASSVMKEYFRKVVDENTQTSGVELGLPTLDALGPAILTGSLSLKDGIQGAPAQIQANNVKIIREAAYQHFDNLVPGIVEFLTQLAPADASTLIRSAYTNALPLFDFDNNNPGINGILPHSFCYCIAPVPTERNNDNFEKSFAKFEELFKGSNLNVNNRTAGEGCQVVREPTANSEELVFVHLLSGLRPNYARNFTVMKMEYLKQKDSRIRCTLTPKQNEWYNDREKEQFPKRNPNEIDQL